MTEFKCPRCGSVEVRGSDALFSKDRYKCEDCNFWGNGREFRTIDKEYSHCDECKVAFEKYNPSTGKPLTRCPKCNSWKIGKLGESFKETKGLWYNPSQRRNEE